MDNLIQTLNRLLALIGKIATIVMIVPIIVAFANFRYLNKPLKILLAFSIIRLFIALLTQFIIWLVSTYVDFFLPILNRLEINNMNFISILAHLNYFSMLGWYYYLIIDNKKIASVIKWVSILLFVSVIINYAFIEGYKIHSVFNSTSSNVFCFILPLIHLWFIYHQDSKVPIVKNPYFSISLGLLVPNLLGLITSIIGKKLRQTDLSLYYQVDIAYSVLQILGYIFIAIGFYYARYTKYLPQNTPSV